jgi:hypothetical protein
VTSHARWLTLATLTLLGSTSIGRLASAQPAAPESTPAPAQTVEQLKAAPKAATGEVRDTARAAEQQARDTGRALFSAAKETARAELEAAKMSAVEKARVETDIFRFGIFPNTAGFMDARAHFRVAYAKVFSSGLYLDYTTARATSEVENESRVDRLVREYRAETDLLKGVLLLRHAGGVAWSLEPGLNAKMIYQDISDSGFLTNSFDEAVFRSSDLAVTQWVSSAKLDTSLVLGEDFTLDFSGEYLPLIYQRETGTSVTSQFDEPVTFAIANRTHGFQGTLTLALETRHVGRYSLTGKAYSNQGDVASKSSLVNGNFEYTFDTFEHASREDYWLELTHTASYIHWFGTLVPAVALAMQKKRITTADDTLSADTYKIGFLLEWL